ncbi:MAG: VWA domain-containing protein [Pseudomonadota bacterium]
MSLPDDQQAETARGIPSPVLGEGQGGGLPRAAAPLVAFADRLRGHGFAVAPDQTIGFLQATDLLGPTGIAAVRRAAIALFAPPRERRAEFDALFDAHFIGRRIAAAAEGAPDDDMEIREDRPGTAPPPETEGEQEAGIEATAAEALLARQFADLTEAEALRRFARLAPSSLPQRVSRRKRRARPGAGIDLRRALRAAARQDGEVLDLPRLTRRTRQRRVLLLLDVSGSMKAQTDGALRLAHRLIQAGERAEVFTFGTRLTRVTGALRLRSEGQALARTGTLVADWDGGTRIGDALEAFLAVPRFAGFARGAAVVVVSDGLERGAPEAMIAAVRRLARLAWRVDWLTPLAAEPGFAPRTEALSGALPHLTDLGDGGSIGAVAEHLLSLGAAR